MPEGLRGAVLRGTAAMLCRDRLNRLCSEYAWRHGELLDAIVSSEDARFPPFSTSIITLRLSPTEWRARLPALNSWWPLCESLRGQNRFLHLEMPDEPALWKSWLVGVKHVARQYPEANFIVDPFVTGPESCWQGNVRLAEQENIALTTLNLFSSNWPENKTEEALNFTIGEVGASALMYASGLDWTAWLAGADRAARERLFVSKHLDGVEKQLVLYLNAEEFFLERAALEDAKEHGFEL